ncbi:MAG: hypothetical protein SVC26_02565 [Pseudomonadota bacterium]|nr:hypothetical protein [Pseudomonadota bacterium]
MIPSNKREQGKHHPDNLQLLLKAHNASKNNTDWVRFTFEEQVDYIKSAIHLQSLIAGRMGIEIDSSVLDSLFVRLKQIY